MSDESILYKYGKNPKTGEMGYFPVDNPAPIDLMDKTELKCRIQELEKQLADTENCRKIACDLLKDWEAGRIISTVTKKQLTESMPKSEIEKLHHKLSIEEGWNTFMILQRLNELLTPPAKENE